jgi:Cu/Zn superoxide dismutase
VQTPKLPKERRSTVRLISPKSRVGQGVKITVSVEDAPVGQKGIHIHEKGDCSDIPGKSMGGHFAPLAESHGLPDEARDGIHLGDLGKHSG